MMKSALTLLSLSMLLTACATESKLAANTGPVEPTAADVSQTMQPATAWKDWAEARPAEVKAVAKPSTDRSVSHLAAAPDFHRFMANWSGAMQSSLTPWTGVIKRCDTQESVK